MYKLTNTSSIIHLGDGLLIPADEDNKDYAAYIDWLERGNTPIPAEPLSAPPIADISPRQIRQALTREGLRGAVEAAVASGSQDLKDWYEFSTAFERENQQVKDMGASLGVNAEQLDALWALGASL